VTRFIGLLLFLLFVDESACAYKTHLFAPMEWVNAWLLEPTPIKIRPFDLIALAILVVGSARRDGRGPHVAPMKNALLLMLATTVVWYVFGIVRGGDARSASWQTYLILSTILLTFAIAATFRTAAHFCSLSKWVVAAAIYRAFMCWVSYYTWGRHLVGSSGAFLTLHDDTIPWVVSILILVVQAVQKRTPLVVLRNGAVTLFLLGALQFNSRRLAWVSLAMGLVMLYFLIPQSGAMKRMSRRALIFAIPALTVYVIVGWGRMNPIFLPLRSISSVSTNEDASTLARNAENLGLIATANYTSALTGSGWGHPYAALTMKYDISSEFELWQYVPHNSILGLLAFTGILGFAGFWLALPTAVFLNARVASMGNSWKARSAALIGAAQLVVCANQLYGDMGIRSIQTMYVMAVSYAMALRLPQIAGVWNAPNPTPPAGVR
jgi:hypothetical protein